MSLSLAEIEGGYRTAELEAEADFGAKLAYVEELLSSGELSTASSSRPCAASSSRSTSCGARTSSSSTSSRRPSTRASPARERAMAKARRKATSRST
jgi:hypothetical protein